MLVMHAWIEENQDYYCRAQIPFDVVVINITDLGLGQYSLQIQRGKHESQRNAEKAVIPLRRIMWIKPLEPT